MNKELEALEFIKLDYDVEPQGYELIKSALKRLEYLEEENKLLRENNENLDETYFETWSACERLKENSNYALMFVDDIYYLVNTKDNRFIVIDNYEINNKGIIDNGTKKKLKALEIIKEKEVNTRFLIQLWSGTNFARTYEDYKNDKKNKLRISLFPLTKEEYDLLKKELL